MTAPGVGNTPPDFLFANGRFDCHFCALLPDIAPDLELLRAHGDIAVNLISDVDQGREMLVLAADLFDQLGKPVINHPRKILATDREAVAQRLSGIPLCRVPRTIRRTRAQLAAPDAIESLRRSGIAPTLLRLAGTHGGDAFERIEQPQDIAAFLQQHQGDAFYATEYVDYRSADGFFRKYRFVFTNGEILPYHLAIADQWKVHHFRTDMGKHVWMQNEEETFLRDPGGVFSQAHYAALRAVEAALGLEFFGIDCALDRDGNIVVFEVNASMLIHDDNAKFPYKTPHCKRIKEAFDCALTRVAHARTEL
jgi:glutathione synthase/RimK-type ligase-like ATP-grasp enzyme